MADHNHFAHLIWQIADLLAESRDAH